MSKISTRKGLAFGALVALTSSVFAGSPALAAGELNLQPSAGTTYGSIIGETFTLNTTTNPGFASSELVKLKYNVVNAGKAALTITAGPNAGTINNTGVVNAGAADNSNYVVTPNSTSTSVANQILVSTAATATSTVTVQSWIDSDLDSVIDSGEWTSAVQSVVFNKASEVTWTTEFTTPAIGDTKFTALVSAAPSINMAQIANANLSVRFGKNAAAPGEQFVGKASATLDSATGKLKFNPTIALVDDAAAVSPAAIASNAAAVAAGFRYDAQAAYLAAGLTAATTEANLVGSQIAYAVAAATITTIAVPTTTDSDNAKTTGGAVAVRSTATTVPVSILVSDGAGALKNTAVTVYVAEKALGGTDTNATTAVGNYDTSSFSAGGQTLKDTSATAQVISFSATTNADGKVLFDLTAVAQAGDGVDVYASAQGVNVNAAAAGALSTAANKTTYTWTAAAPQSVVSTDLKGTSAVLKQAAGSTFSLNFTVLDQFGAAIPTADKYRVAVSDGTFAAGDANQYAVTSAGKATVSFTLPSTATVTKTYTYKAQTKAVDGNFGTDLAGSTVSVVVGTSNAASSFTALGDITVVGTQAALSTTATNTIAVNGTRTSVLDTVAFVAGDKNAGATNTVKGTLTSGVALSGAVTDATTAGTYSTVTFAGTNLNFVVGTTLYATGTVTVQTDASGNYAGVRVLSNKTGKQTLTITAGSVSKSYVLDFGLNADTSGTALTVTAPTYILPGRTLVITGVLADKYGNAVNTVSTTDATNDNAAELLGDFAVTYDGPGLIVGALPTETDADGKFSIRVLLGANETGSATLTAKYDANGDADYADTGDLSVSKTVQIGAAPAIQPIAAIAGSTKRFYVSVTDNTGAKNVVVKVAGKTLKTLKGSVDKKTYVVAAPKGTHKVTVYVGGKLVLSKTISVK